MILHAGDIGNTAVLDALREIAPVVAVRGNNDKGECRVATGLGSSGDWRRLDLHVARLERDRYQSRGTVLSSNQRTLTQAGS